MFYMKAIFIIAASALLLCGCSRKHGVSSPSAIDRVQAGKDIKWSRGFVLHIDKRSGSFLEGVHIRATDSHGQTSTLIAGTGCITPGGYKDPADKGEVTLALTNAQIQSAGKTFTKKVMYVYLSSRPK